MEFERNYMGYNPMIGNMDNCYMQHQKLDNKFAEKMPYMNCNCIENWEKNPNMCCKYMNMYGNMPMNYSMRGDCMMHQMYHQSPVQQMESLETLCGKTYKILIVHVHNSMHKIMMENMGVMPKAISKEKFKHEMNYMICEVMKNEEEIKKIVVIDRNETGEQEEMDREFCPFCNGLLKDTLSILFITELLRAGCVSCY